jgi:hypothetical protein
LKSGEKDIQNNFLLNMQEQLKKHVWKAQWYMLDQSIWVGQLTEFWLEKNNILFFTGSINDEHDIIKGKILSITHPKLGAVQKIDTSGLLYKITLENGSLVTVDSEESPGSIEWPDNLKIDNWEFEVLIEQH